VGLGYASDGHRCLPRRDGRPAARDAR
jgi:hypothetical protein